MAVAKCSRCVPPILRHCFVLNHIIDGNTTTTYTSRAQPKAQGDLEQSMKHVMEDGYSTVTRKIPYPLIRNEHCTHNLLIDCSQALLHKTYLEPVSDDYVVLKSAKPCTDVGLPGMSASPVSLSMCVSESTSSGHAHAPDQSSPSSAQLSYVLLRLREELPGFFKKRHSFDIYDAQLKFVNRLFPLPLYLRTRTAYKSYLVFCRYLTIALYSNASFELLKITKEDDSGEIKARWRIRGLPRLIPWLSHRVILDGFSTFLVDNQGKIFLHKAEKMMPSTKEKTRLSLWISQIGFITGLSTPEPTK